MIFIRCYCKISNKPWFQIKFNIYVYSVLHHEPARFRDAYLLITVKDSGFMGNGIFLGEALLPMDEIQVIFQPFLYANNT